MLLEPLLRHGKDRPEALAFRDANGDLSWGETAARVAVLGSMLRGATQQPTVGILLPAASAFPVAFYATLAAGKTAVPINFLLGEQAIGHIIADSGIDTIITAPPLKAQVEKLPLNIIDLTELASAPSPQAPPAAPHITAEADDAALLYTSGTSGKPKGVRLTHGNIHHDVTACIEHAALAHNHTFLGIIPLFHSTGLLATMVAPTTLGATTIYQPRFSPVGTLGAIREHKISVMAAVPAMYGAILRLKDATPGDFASMYLPLSGGEPLPGRIRAGFKQRFDTDLMEGYGLTETCGPIAVNMPHQHRPGSVGRLIPAGEVRIADPDDTGQGEVQLKGPMVFAGYHNLPDETANAFTDDGYFKTGDLGRVDEDGYLHITGRLKDLIIIGGENLHPRELEELLAAHPAIAQAAVVGKPDDTRGEVPVAFLVPAEGATVDAEIAKAHIRDTGLPNWKQPRAYHIVEELPMSPTGKVLKRELASQV
ncbi:MAG: AMP-binding protein [Planctomycetota bacterium]